jgi:hypothetical protein
MGTHADAARLAERLGGIVFGLEHLSVRPVGSEEGFLLEAPRALTQALARLAVRCLTRWPAAERLFDGLALSLRRAADLIRGAGRTVHLATRPIIS